MPETTDEMINVLVAANFDDDLMERIRNVSPRLNVRRQYPDIPDAMWETTEILYSIRHFPEPDQVPELKWIQTHSAGLERALAKDIVQSDKVVVTSTSGIHSTQMAQYSLMMLLAFHYKLSAMLEFQRQSTWGKADTFAPIPLENLTLGIIGYGSIGRELARLVHAMGMTVLASKRDIKRPEETKNDYTENQTGDPDASIPERLYPPSAIATMVKDCDYVLLATPLTDETRHMINTEIFDAMKETAVLINVARGGVVDEEAMIQALKKGKIAGAALDVFSQEPLPADSPLWQMDNVLISPHISGNSQEYHSLATDLFIANLQRYLNNDPLM
ncbi:MAG: D-2-hydroxyacid dehydrogenase, partial [Aggregatilineales bacterium]